MLPSFGPAPSNRRAVGRASPQAIQPFASQRIPRFTIQRFNNSTIQQFNDSTIQRFNNSTIQQFNDSTIQYLITTWPAKAIAALTSITLPNSYLSYSAALFSFVCAAELNTDFSMKGLSPQEITAIVAAWQAKAISRNTMTELFRKGKVLPAEERARRADDTNDGIEN
jgi:hypothetical protein